MSATGRKRARRASSSGTSSTTSTSTSTSTTSNAATTAGTAHSVYDDGRTWSEVVRDPRVSEKTRVLAASLINARDAYYFRLHSVLFQYFAATGVDLRPPRDYVHNTLASQLYDMMLQEARQEEQSERYER